MKKLSLYLKYAVLVIIVIGANYFLFTYNHQNGPGQNIFKRRILGNLDIWKNLSDAGEKLDEIEIIRNTCDNLLLKRDSNNLDVLFITKDKIPVYLGAAKKSYRATKLLSYQAVKLPSFQAIKPL